VAGKTGTSQDFRDAWFIGYTGALTAGVWFGNDDDSPTKKASGSNLPATAWHRFMTDALKGIPPADLPGSYHYEDPANLVAAGGLPRQYGNAQAGDQIGALAASDGAWFDGPAPDGAGPIPLNDVGGDGIPPPPRRRGFFQRLFGG
jgi:penicillin-binding protein 1A